MCLDDVSVLSLGVLFIAVCVDLGATSEDSPGVLFSVAVGACVEEIESSVL